MASTKKEVSILTENIDIQYFINNNLYAELKFMDNTIDNFKQTINKEYIPLVDKKIRKISLPSLNVSSQVKQPLNS